MKQVAGLLSVPVFLVDASGDLVYFNEPAEAILGYRYEESPELAVEQWGAMFSPTADEGQRVAPRDLPLAVALERGRPVQGALAIRGRDGVPRSILIEAIPLLGHGGRTLGGLAFFWEPDGE